MNTNSSAMPVTRGGHGRSSATCPATINTSSKLHEISITDLRAAARKVRLDASPGVDHVRGREYMKEVHSRLARLHQKLREGIWGPRPVRRAWIPKGNDELRPLGIPTFEDKILQWHLVLKLEPGMEAIFLSSSYGFRPSIGTIDACKRIKSCLRQWQGAWVLDADIRKFFDTIDHGRLMAILKSLGIPRHVLRMIYKFLKARVQDGKQLMKSKRGTPQGGVISPLLSNVFLHVALDIWFNETILPTLAGKAELIRYADDFVILAEREAEARYIWKAVSHRLKEFGLTLHGVKTRLIDCHPGVMDAPPTALAPRRLSNFNFLGFNFRMTPEDSSLLAQVKVTTSEVAIMKSISTWHEKSITKWYEEQTEDPLGHIERAISGFLYYQNHLSNHEGLLNYIKRIRPVLEGILRNAKATNQTQRLTAMLAPENIPTLIETARRRGSWHKDNHGIRRTYRAGNPQARAGAGGSTGTIPPPRAAARG